MYLQRSSEWQYKCHNSKPTFLVDNVNFRQWTKEFDEEESGVSLNLKQKEGSLAITSKSDAIIPAVLLIGPFGTGKTLTLARSIIHLLNEPNTRILVCTHSNRYRYLPEGCIIVFEPHLYMNA